MRKRQVSRSAIKAACLTILVIFSIVTNSEVLGQVKVDFAHDILPVLKSKCAKCHSNDVYKGGLSLETRGKLIDSGTVKIGSKNESDLFDRITSNDPDYRMPPEGERLTKAEIGKFASWIDGDLEWPESLSLKKKTFARPLKLQAVPLPKMEDGGSNHPIDRILSSYFNENSVQLPKRLSARKFYRRAKLDLLGQIPTIAELEKISALTAEQRSVLIDRLLARDRDYADHWMSFWNDMLRNDYVGTGYIDGGRKQITQWLHRSLMENKPYDQFVRELINPKDESAGFIKGIKWRGRVNASQIEPLQFSQNISQVFLGINMKCASCHDSFIDDWKLEDAYGLAAITSDKPLEMHRCDVPTGKMASSKFVFPDLGEIDQTKPRTERLARLADLMIAPENGRFPRTIVNRIWHRMIGRGLVHPVDVMANEAWSEPLLDFLAADLVEHNFDLKRTMKLIATSDIYALQTCLSEENSSDLFVFRGVIPKRLTAEQFVDAIWSITKTEPGGVDAAIHLPAVPPTGKWIWSSEGAVPAGEVVTFRYQFDVEKMPTRAAAVATCDNSFQMFLNGKNVGKGNEWTQPKYFELMSRIKKGKNDLIIRAVNGGKSPNLAALFVQVEMSVDDRLVKFHSDSSWKFVKRKLNPGKIPNGLPWNSAVEIENVAKIYGSVNPKLATLVGRFSAYEVARPRAALVKSNDLMRSLGRPNREQVVTTRPEELSTLQALDLSNGATMTDWLRKGAQFWTNQKLQKAWSNRELVVQLFEVSLSRRPTDEEIELLMPEDKAVTQYAVEDMLWMVIMLPEFQFVQ